MIQLVLLELCQEGGTKHTFPMTLVEYLRHVNSQGNYIHIDPYEQEKYVAQDYALEPRNGDKLHLKTHCNGNGAGSATFVVKQCNGIRGIFDDDILPCYTRVKARNCIMTVDTAYHCLIKEVSEDSDIAPIEVHCLTEDKN